MDRGLDPRVRAAMEAVRRADFLPWAERPLADLDAPLAIGHGQTTSQPSLVAMMLERLRVEPGAKVLEVGTGCGYQTALLATLGARVFTVEYLEPLATVARARLERLGYRGIAFRVGDGYAGWPEEAPFDAIIVSAGAARVPPPLVAQLAPGGRLLVPVGPMEAMALVLVTRGADGVVARERWLPVRFVPLLGAPAEEDRRAPG